MQAQPARAGRLSIRTTPDAATVVIDGQTRGLSPLTVPELAPGPHELTIRKAGFLENRTTVQVRADATDTVTIVLTALPQTPGGPIVTPADNGCGGSKMKWYVLGGAGAAIAAVLAGKSGSGGGGTTTIQTTTTTSIGSGSSTTIPSTTTGATIFAIRGRVTDSQNGAPIPGAQPTVVGGPQAGTKPGADSNGNYVITGLPAGSYNIEFRAQDYDLSPAQNVTIVNSDVTEDRRMSLTVPRANFSQSPNPCVANGTATTPGLTCTLDGGSSQNRIDSYEWSYQDGSGTGQSHPMSAACRGRAIGINQLQVTLTVRNRAGSDSSTKNVPVNKIAGCF
jgi:hypothetical protein